MINRDNGDRVISLLCIISSSKWSGGDDGLRPGISRDDYLRAWHFHRQAACSAAIFAEIARRRIKPRSRSSHYVSDSSLSSACHTATSWGWQGSRYGGVAAAGLFNQWWNEMYGLIVRIFKPASGLMAQVTRIDVRFILRQRTHDAPFHNQL